VGVNTQGPSIVVFTGHRSDVKPIEIIKAIRKHTGLGLRAAKDPVDRFIAGEQALVEVSSVDIARAIARDVVELCATVEIRNPANQPEP